ncbi:MAG: hypothetical protein KKB30_04685 [Proteobacteria bacterium]|nr:hypothetical protein [Pseudomonadota bacterium]MBU1715495.1 hypothetical protein [Pseudomonadota bacterium]
MARFKQSLVGLVLGCLIFGVLCGVGNAKAKNKSAKDGGVGSEVRLTSVAVVQDYTNMPELVHLICQQAIGHFYDFFGPANVYVEPFLTANEFGRARVSVLGFTLADQMISQINNETSKRYMVSDKKQQQWLRGVLQEEDGFLRVHISGVNWRGERRSYVVNVEMSERLYRTLHSYIKG